MSEDNPVPEEGLVPEKLRWVLFDEAIVGRSNPMSFLGETSVFCGGERVPISTMLPEHRFLVVVNGQYKQGRLVEDPNPEVVSELVYRGEVLPRYRFSPPPIRERRDYVVPRNRSALIISDPEEEVTFSRDIELKSK